ncbi:VOC family protein [Cohnella yongneupensis]|uniref:VOC family protein n=1 Tax=Cohnella yongneupensis TaxID=425006 RepID=A0ABW0QXQ1_9BACL
MEKAKLNGPTMVLLVRNLVDSIAFYRRIGFQDELVGGPDEQHVHMNRDAVTFILHQARNPEDVKPFSSAAGGLYFDAFCYTDVRALLEEVRVAGVPIVNGPDLNDFFSEFTIQDVDGYRIAFGG